MQKRTNPLFPSKKTEGEKVVSNLHTIEAGSTLSPISHKPMKEVMAGTIPAYYDEDNRVVFPKRA